MVNKDCVECKDKMVKALEESNVFYKLHIYIMYFKGREYIRYNCNVTVHWSDEYLTDFPH
jgi:hypothetical protein